MKNGENNTRVEVDTETALADKKYIALYFSAHWCGPCRRFTPLLSVTYEDQTENEVEVVFVSNDSDDDGFATYFGTMPWLAVAFSDSKRREDLGLMYKVGGIPHLVVLDAATGKVVDGDARARVVSKKRLDGIWEGE